MPDDKVKIVRKIEETVERLVFVGDDVNDAPALAAATVGLSMDAVRTDGALETAAAVASMSNATYCVCPSPSSSRAGRSPIRARLCSL